MEQQLNIIERIRTDVSFAKDNAKTIPIQTIIEIFTKIDTNLLNLIALINPSTKKDEEEEAEILPTPVVSNTEFVKGSIAQIVLFIESILNYVRSHVLEWGWDETIASNIYSVVDSSVSESGHYSCVEEFGYSGFTIDDGKMTFFNHVETISSPFIVFSDAKSIVDGATLKLDLVDECIAKTTTQNRPKIEKLKVAITNISSAIEDGINGIDPLIEESTADTAIPNPQNNAETTIENNVIES